MDIPTALLRDILNLASSIDVGEEALTGPLAALIADLRRAVPSYRGLHLTMVEDGSPISLTALSIPDGDGAITSSLRLPFSVLGSAFGPDCQIVLYAGAPGAFVDLAADLGYALNTPVITPDLPAHRAGSEGSENRREEGDGQRPIVLDADLRPPARESGLSGLVGASTMNRAIGILIDQGHHPDHAHAVLRHRAAHAGVEPHVYAARLLRP